MPELTVWRLRAGIASATSTAAAAPPRMTGWRITRPTTAPHRRDSPSARTEPSQQRYPAALDPVAELGQHRRQDRERAEERNGHHQDGPDPEGSEGLSSP